MVLKESQIDTPLGPMRAIADEKALYLLEFVDRKGLKKEIERLQTKTGQQILHGRTQPLEQIEAELKEYYSGKLQTFQTPFATFGTPFQKRVWEELQKIPFGQTCSYAELAAAIGKPTAFRAVALANGANQLAIIIPCHRVINSSGALGGYGGGIHNKEWLLKHERR